MSTFLNRWFGPAEDLKAVHDRGAILLDVRSLQEFEAGHIDGALHIPVDQLNQRTAGLKAQNKPVIACCASGMRSGMAKQILSAAGIEAYNGGSWLVLKRKLQ